MNAAEFETGLQRAGYLDVETKQAKPDLTTQPHSHPSTCARWSWPAR